MMSGVSGNPELFGCCLFFLASFNLHSSTSATFDDSTYFVEAFDVGVGVGVGVDFLTVNPLLQTNFFPDLMQVYFLPS